MVPIPLTRITSTEILKLALEPLASQFRVSDHNDNDSIRMAITKAQPSSSLHRLLAKLWDAVAKPVIDHLNLRRATGRTRPRIHWCPTGVFTFAPVHAAGIYKGKNQECISDYAVSSYTPTLTALLHAQKNAYISKASTSKFSVIAAERAQDPSLSTLWNINDEITEVVKIISRVGISVEKQNTTTSATVSELLEKFESSNFIHVACHGVQDPRAPLKSSFCVSDGTVSVQELMNLDLKNAFLAFLSACETAKGDREQPDQTIHLAAAMLFVGFKSVIATLWAMNDQDGPHIAKSFYDRLFEREQIAVDDVAYALDHAVAELRRSGAPLERWATFVHMGA